MQTLTLILTLQCALDSSPRCGIGVFGPGSLKEVFDRGGKITTCKEGTKSEPCSRFVYSIRCSLSS